MQQLRTLVGAVGEVPRFNEVRALTLTEVVDRPAQALHAALSELPRALPFGSAELVFDAAPELSPYEQAWQRAAGASLGLELYVDVLHQLPDSTAWHVLRDLTDAAAALPYLDHDLSEAVRLTRTSAAQVQEAYRQLVHPGHHAVRIVTADVRARVPAPPNRSAAPPHRHMQMAASPEPTASAAAGDGSPVVDSRSAAGNVGPAGVRRRRHRGRADGALRSCHQRPRRPPVDHRRQGRPATGGARRQERCRCSGASRAGPFRSNRRRPRAPRDGSRSSSAPVRSRTLHDPATS